MQQMPDLVNAKNSCALILKWLHWNRLPWLRLWKKEVLNERQDLLAGDPG